MPFDDDEKEYRDRKEKKRTLRLMEKEDEERTEFYRINPQARPIGLSENELPPPFRICIIDKITPYRGDDGEAKIWLRVRLLFRPEDVDAAHLSRRKRNRFDVNEVFWSVKTRKVDATNLRGKVHLLPKDLVPEPKDNWKNGDCNRYAKIIRIHVLVC